MGTEAPGLNGQKALLQPRPAQPLIRAVSSTPSFGAPVTVPFLWEEAPGRPKPHSASVLPAEGGAGAAGTDGGDSDDDGASKARVMPLKLPPRLQVPSTSAADHSSLSPRTVLQGPYYGCSSGAWRPPRRVASFCRVPSARGGFFSRRKAVAAAWRTDRKGGLDHDASCTLPASSSSSSSSAFFVGDDSHGYGARPAPEEVEGAKGLVRITRMRINRSHNGAPHADDAEEEHGDRDGAKKAHLTPLKLPPRLLVPSTAARDHSSLSPRTVLQGPYYGCAGGAWRPPRRGGRTPGAGRGFFSRRKTAATNWRADRKGGLDHDASCMPSPSSASSSSSSSSVFFVGDDSRGYGGGARPEQEEAEGASRLVRITRIRMNRSVKGALHTDDAEEEHGDRDDDDATEARLMPLKLPPRLQVPSTAATDCSSFSHRIVQQGPYNGCTGGAWRPPRRFASFHRTPSARGGLFSPRKATAVTWRTDRKGGLDHDASCTPSTLSASSSSSSLSMFFFGDDSRSHRARLDSEEAEGANVSVRIARFRRNMSLLSMTTSTSHILASIRKSVKQIAPWS